MNDKHETDLEDKNVESFEVGTSVASGEYQCAACGYIIRVKDGGELPTCPEDQGLHAIRAWRPVEDAERRDKREDSFINAPPSVAPSS